MTRRPLIFILGFAAMTTLLAGCGQGSSLYRATGTVRYKGQPVEGAIVTFRCEPLSKIATGTTDGEGRFELTTYSAGKGAVAGKHKVTVTKLSAPAGVSTLSSMQEMVDVAKKPAGVGAQPNQLPTRYASPETSLLEFEVTASGPNDFQIELVD
jgi:hypothetical protein